MPEKSCVHTGQMRIVGTDIWRGNLELYSSVKERILGSGSFYMVKGANQKFKLFYLAKIMQEKTDETHYITMPEIIEELGNNR